MCNQGIEKKKKRERMITFVFFYLNFDYKKKKLNETREAVSEMLLGLKKTLH